MLVLVIVLIFHSLQLESALGDGEAGYKALKFGQDANSYISFSPDMSPFQNEYSVCSWVKKLRPSWYPTWFHYETFGEIWITDSGTINHILGSDLRVDLTREFTTPQGQWFHQCNTWSLRSGTGRVYLNGILVGTVTTSSRRTPRTLRLGGLLIIGNSRLGHSYYFGGELYQLNVYSEELSSSDVQALAGGGPCSGGEELHDDTRLLKWEDILQKSRTGNVREIAIDSDTSACTLGKQLRENKSQLNQTESRLNATLVQTRKEMEQQLNSTAHELYETQQQLNSTAHALDEATKQLENFCTPWDLLYSEPFFNDVFTEDLFRKLSSSWDIFENFVARVKITHGMMNHFTAYYKAYPDDEV